MAKPRPVLMVSMDWWRPNDGRRSLGAASIVAALRVEGVAVEWLDDAVNHPEFDLAAFAVRVRSAAEELGPDVLIGIGCYVWNEAEVLELLASLTAVDVVLGGPQVSYTEAGELAHRYPTVRHFVRGYGERAMVALALGEQTNGEHGLFDRNGLDRGTRENGELTHLPSPYSVGVLEMTSAIRLETQRGCPFRCSFCQHREPGRRHHHRRLGEDRIASDLRVAAEAGVRRISVLDPIFNTRRDHAARVLDAARAVGLQAKLCLQCRFEMVTPAFLDGLRGLDVTLEFGLQTVQTNEGRLVGRQNNLEKVAAAIAMVRDREVDFEVSLIFGLPEQTLASFLGSVQWCLAQGIPRVIAYPLMLLRGTPIWEERERWGYVETSNVIPTVQASNSFSVADKEVMGEVATWLAANQGATALPTRWHAAAGEVA